MSRPLRLEFPGSLWHVTQRGNERRPTFHTDADRVHFLDLLAEVVRRFKWIVTAHALMLNHYHLLLELADSDTLSRGMKWLNGNYAQWFNRQYGRTGHLFQGRFHGCLVDGETYFLEVLRYIVLNPVRANIVKYPDEYAWTSYRATAGLIEPPEWLAVDRIREHFASVELYRAFVREGIGSSVRPWDAVVGGMYLGPDDWLAKVRERVEAEPRDRQHASDQRTLLRPSMSDIVTSVSTVLGVDEDRVRVGRGGLPRTVAAWLGCYEGMLTNIEIAAALRLRSDSRVTKLVSDFDRQLQANSLYRDCIDQCVATLRRKNSEVKT